MSGLTSFEQQQLLQQPDETQRIKNSRLEKELYFLKQSKLSYRIDSIENIKGQNFNHPSSNSNPSSIFSQFSLNVLNLPAHQTLQSQINCRILIQGNQLIQNQLILFIPKNYPFSEPLYYYKHFYQAQNEKYDQKNKNLLKYQIKPEIQQIRSEFTRALPISELFFWTPKYKILELVELISIKIKQKLQQETIISNYSLGQMANQFNTLSFWFGLGILLRILVAFGSYSGKEDWPNLGDFQAHRNWMSITVNRPIQEWYFETQQNVWWRIDYPPIAAYISYIFGSIYKLIEPKAMILQRGYESPTLCAFMRFTVLFVEIIFLFPAIYLLSCQSLSSQYTITKKYTLLVLVSLLLKPDLILIDHGHFQYNSLIIGLILGAFYCLLNKKYYICCLLFTIAIHSKQMAVYYALAFFAGLIGKVIDDHRNKNLKIVGQILKFGVIVIIVSLIIWLPFIIKGSVHNILEAIFPVHRGLYQLKVQNFWCISDVIMKWQSKLSKGFLMAICFIICTIMSLPSMAAMMFSSSKKTITLGFFSISMTFFMFSYHVHQKSILLPLAIAPLLIQYLNPSFVSSLVLSEMIGMYHLLKQDGQSLQYFALLGLYLLFINSFNSITYDLKKFVLEPEKDKSFTQNLHQQIFSSNKNSLLPKITNYTLILIPILLHLAQMIFKPPIQLQYLHHLLFAFYSFCFNTYSLVLCNGILIESLIVKITDKKIQPKSN